MNLQTNQKYQQVSGSSEFIIRIRGGKELSVQGKIEHVSSGQVQYFNDFLEMIYLIQLKLDEKGYPQSDTKIRSFTNPTNV